MIENVFNGFAGLFSSLSGGFTRLIEALMRFFTYLLNNAINRPYWSIGLLLLLLAGRGSKKFKIGNSEIKL